MNLYILRHGIAEDVSATGRDRDRELTREGIEKTRATGKALRKLGVTFDRILSSPYARAWKTAEIVAGELDCGKLLTECEPLASGRPAGEVLAALQELDSGKSVLIVGHEPDLSSLISIFLSGDSGLSITMKKGGLCKLSLGLPRPGAATLEWLLAPKHLERIP